MARQRRRAKPLLDLRRRSAFRNVPDRVLIVTEGSKTEPTYFQLLISELRLTTAKVKILGDGGSAPINVIEDAQRHLAQDDDFEQVYCVFDRDRHTSYDKALATVRKLAAKRKFKSKTFLAITSVPCFELWYLLHVSNSRRPYADAKTTGSPAKALIRELKRKDPFQQYEKKGCEAFFSLIAANRNTASKRARRFLQEAKTEGVKEFHENPSTRVHLVVEALCEIAKKQNNGKS